MTIADCIIEAKQAGKWQSDRYYRPAAGSERMDEQTYKRLLQTVAEAEDELYALQDKMFAVQTKLSNARSILVIADRTATPPVDPMAVTRCRDAIARMKPGGAK